MSERIEEFLSAEGQRRVVIVRRPDGLYSLERARQLAHEELNAAE